MWLQAHLKDSFGVDLEGAEGENILDKGKGKAVEEEEEIEEGTGYRVSMLLFIRMSLTPSFAIPTFFLV